MSSEAIERVRPIVHKSLEVIDAEILRESSKWLTAVVAVKAKFGGREQVSVRFYRWQHRNGAWKKQSSFNINRPEDWSKIKQITDGMVEVVWAV